LAGERPDDVVHAMYTALIHPLPAVRGQPEYRRVEALLAPDLRAALRAQVAYEKACARLVPADAKPCMLDQSPFFLAPDGARAIESTEARVTGSVAKVVARLAYDDLRWNDTVTLVLEHGSWKVVNISWAEGGSLTQRLKEFAAYRCAPNNSSKPTPLRGAA